LSCFSQHARETAACGLEFRRRSRRWHRRKPAQARGGEIAARGAEPAAAPSGFSVT
jgi:hypothetical protein